MRRPGVVVILFVVLATVVLVGAGSVALGVVDGVGAETQQPENEDDPDWREYDPDDEFGIDADDGLADDELDAVVDRAMVRVETIRDVEFEERPPVTVITREEFREEYGGLAAEPSEESATFQNAKYRALFLAGDDEDAVESRAENQGAAVSGFYSPSEGEIVIVAEGDQPRMDEVILAHELFHAYQDQRWGLANYDAVLRDGRNAELGLIEGDAVYVETLYEERCGEEWECVIPPDEEAEPGEPEGPEQPANIGILLLDFQPYDDGPVFVERLYEQGGWNAVDAVYDDPPETAKGVIDPDVGPDADARDPGIDDDHGEGWERVEPEDRPDHERLGMAAITTMFVNPLYDSGGEEWVVPADEWFTTGPDEEPPPYGALNYGSAYATGWDGDRLHVYEHEDGDLGYVWRIAWESPEDADTFLEGFDELLAYWGGERVASDTYVIEEGGYEGAYHVALDEDVVTITHAPEVDGLTDVSADAEPDTGDPVPQEAETADGDGEGPEDELPGFGIAVAVVALLAAAYAVVRRRR
jgi:PGF-CTERM protein